MIPQQAARLPLDSSSRRHGEQAWLATVTAEPHCRTLVVPQVVREEPSEDESGFVTGHPGVWDRPELVVHVALKNAVVRG